MQVRGGAPDKKRIEISPRQRNILIGVFLAFMFFILRGPSSDSGKKGPVFDDKELPVTVNRGTDWSDDRMSGMDVGPRLGEIPPDQPRTGLREGEIPEAVQVGGAAAKKTESRLSQLSSMFGGDSDKDAAMFDGNPSARMGEPDTFVNGVYFPEERPDWANPPDPNYKPTVEDIKAFDREPEKKTGKLVPAYSDKPAPSSLPRSEPRAEALPALEKKKAALKPKKAKPEFRTVTVPTAGQSSVSSKASYKPVDIPAAPKAPTNSGGASTSYGKSNWKPGPRTYRDAETGNATRK